MGKSNLRMLISFTLRKSAFNGATLSRTWKHETSADAGAGEFASMEPRSAERGNVPGLKSPQSRSAASMEPRSAERGNRAMFERSSLDEVASMEPRSAERGNVRRRGAPHLPRGASMEPRSAERGNVPLEIHARRATAGFNGATLSRTWKPAAEEGYLTDANVLQWSHAQPNVETLPGL